MTSRCNADDSLPARTGERQPIRPLLAAAVALLVTPVSNPALAGDIYRWVGEDGVVHYSDTRPHGDVPVTVVAIETARTAEYEPVDDPYSILNQASRIHQVWLDFEAARRARARERLDAMAYSPLASPPPDQSYYRYSTYTYYPIRSAPVPGHRPGDRHEQLRALDTLDLLGRRPQSINSGVHLGRVTRSQFLPIVPPQSQ